MTGEQKQAYFVEQYRRLSLFGQDSRQWWLKGLPLRESMRANKFGIIDEFTEWANEGARMRTEHRRAEGSGPWRPWMEDAERRAAERRQNNWRVEGVETFDI